HAGKVGISATRGRDAHGEACHASHEHVSVRVVHGVGGLRGVFAIASSTFSEAGADADRHPESIAAATAEYLLAVSGLVAPGHRTPTVGSAAADEGTSVGGDRAGGLLCSTPCGRRTTRRDRGTAALRQNDTPVGCRTCGFR